jgi:hypothetical protein
MAKEQKSVGELKGLADLTAGLGDLTADQVRGAVDMYFDYLKRTVAAAPSGGTEFGDRLKDYAEKNISMTHEFVRRLSHAKDLREMLSIQIESCRPWRMLSVNKRRASLRPMQRRRRTR